MVEAAQAQQDVRETAEEILESPEFRHFRRLTRESRRSSDAPWGKASGGQGSGGEAGENGGGRGDSGGGGGMGGDSTRPADRRSGETESDRSERARGIRAPNIGGAFAGAFGAAFHAAAWLFLIAVCGCILFLIIKAFLEYERPARLPAGGEEGPLVQDDPPQEPPGGLPADVYLARARELAAEGRFREAVGQLILGGMSTAERAGLIKFRHGLTHRDYVRAMRHDDRLQSAMKSIVRTYEPLGFGRREARRDHFEDSLSHYQTAFSHPERPNSEFRP